MKKQIIEHCIKTVAGNTTWLILLGVLGVLGVALYSVWSWLSATVELQRWHYALVFIGGLVAGFAAAVVLFRLANKQDAAEGSDHLRYIEDQFFGIFWRWLWTLQGRLDADSITGYCPSCFRRLIYAPQYDDSTVFHCQGCDHKRAVQGDMRTIQGKVAIEIEHKLNEITRAKSSIT